MEIKTFNEILTELCDDFDVMISPKSIARTNTNIIYLIFKAIAKGYEVIHNVVVALSNKFNPAFCSDEDLESTAFLVGTERLKGSYSGLSIKIINNNETATTISEGTYSYALDDDTKFYFTLKEDTSIAPSAYLEVIALTDKVGSFKVTSQASITVNTESQEATIPSGVTFSCSNNLNLLGTEQESLLDFRKRILSNTNRQDVINELETKIKNLPYVFDCSIIFNETLDDVSVGDIEVPPYNMLIIISGEARDEIAKIVASTGIYPTVEVESTDYIDYENEVFSSGKYRVYYTNFSSYNYSVNVTYKYDDYFTIASIAEEKMRSYLLEVMQPNVRKPIITENDFYNALEELNLEGIEILSVELYVNSSRVQYVTVPEDKIPKLSSVTFSEG